MYSSAEFKTMFPELSKLYTQEELDKACSYLPDNDGTDFPKWVETVNATVDEPICPFVGWCECNSAGSDRCHTCSFAQEMFVYSMGGQAKRDTIQPEKAYRIEYEVYDIFDKLIETAEKDFKACTIDDAIEDAEIYLSEVFNTDSSAYIVRVSCPDEDKWYGTEDYYPSC